MFSLFSLYGKVVCVICFHLFCSVGKGDMEARTGAGEEERAQGEGRRKQGERVPGGRHGAQEKGKGALTGMEKPGTLSGETSHSLYMWHLT